MVAVARDGAQTRGMAGRQGPGAPRRLPRHRRGHRLLLRKPREVEEGDKVDRLSRGGRDN